MIHKTRSQIKTIVFPEVLKAISQGILLQKEKIPIVEILPTFSLDYIDIYPDNKPKEALEGIALTI